jgi:hypothetical protein
MDGKVKRPQREAENSVFSCTRAKNKDDYSSYHHFMFSTLQTNSGQASGEITRLLWNLKLHKIPSLVTNLKQMNSVHTLSHPI